MKLKKFINNHDGHEKNISHKISAYSPSIVQTNAHDMQYAAKTSGNNEIPSNGDKKTPFAANDHPNGGSFHAYEPQEQHNEQEGESPSYL